MQTTSLNKIEINQLLSAGKFWQVLKKLEESEHANLFEDRLKGVQEDLSAFDQGKKSPNKFQEQPTQNQLCDTFRALIKDLCKPGEHQLKTLPMRTKRKNIPLEFLNSSQQK
ncbi:MAG: hypothetical protein R8P61_06880 [Bacteroidia bacterium]|nr:hypothetical protein [Bacteroidia bacterium]